MCDGCGRGCNEFAGRVQNHHLRFSFHRNGHINLSCDSQRDKKLLQFWTLYVAGYAKDAIVDACHRTSDGQEHKDYLACWTRTRHDFSLTCHSVQRARQPLSRRVISITVAGDILLQLIRLESLGSELQES